jgi:hypothetical protein
MTTMAERSELAYSLSIGAEYCQHFVATKSCLRFSVADVVFLTLGTLILHRNVSCIEK